MTEALFDLSQEYDEMLNRGIRLSGEDKYFFIRGRVGDLVGQLPVDFNPGRILDFGCGTGDTSRYLAECFPEARVVGVDTAKNALNFARKKHGSERISFRSLDGFAERASFDLCYVNGVFHHIEPDHRRGAAELIRDALVKGGYFAFFENNPLNPGTLMVMKRIPFDRDARPLTHRETNALLRDAGFERRVCTRFLFYFPRPLAVLRSCERWLTALPLGAQYYTLAVR